MASNPLSGRKFRTSFPKALQPIFGKQQWRVVRTIMDGNCGPDAVSLAMNTSSGKLTIQDIRQMLATTITDNNFERKKEHFMRTSDPEFASKFAAVENVEQLQNVVKNKNYYLNNDDISCIGRKLGVFIVIVNQIYGQKRFGHLGEILVLVNPFEKTDKHFLKQIKEGKPVKTIMLYNQSAINLHYELIMKVSPTTNAINMFSELPLQIQAYINNQIKQFLVDIPKPKKSPKPKDTKPKQGTRAWAEQMARILNSWYRENDEVMPGSCRKRKMQRKY